MKLVLIGFMGSGKTTVGRLLSIRLGLPCVEIDEQIIAESNYSSVAEIFAAEGEESFRCCEADAAERCSSLSGVIISTGGGIVLREANIEALRRGGGYLIHLSTTFPEIAKRLAGDKSRPLWQDNSQAHQLYNERSPRYATYSDYTVTTDGLSPDQVAEKIVSLLEGRSTWV